MNSYLLVAISLLPLILVLSSTIKRVYKKQRNEKIDAKRRETFKVVQGQKNA